MYWNVPKDHRKIQRVILTTQTITQLGVMLSSPAYCVLSQEKPILSPALWSYRLPPCLYPTDHWVFYHRALTMAWSSPILSQAGHSKIHTCGFCYSADNSNLILSKIALEHVTFPRKSLSLTSKDLFLLYTYQTCKYVLIPLVVVSRWDEWN